MISDVLPGTKDETPRVVVTASDEVGIAIAARFHADGARVHLAHAGAEEMVRLLAEYPGMHGTVTDIADPTQVDDMVNEAATWMGGVDVLVNAAGEVGSRGPLHELDDGEWRRVLDVNVTGMFHCIRAVLPQMQEQLGGAIVNLGSHAARTGLPKRAAYAVSKAGVLGLTRNVAREYGRYNIRCNAVLPGMLDDEAGRELVRARSRSRRVSLDEAEAEILEHVSMRAWIEPSEVAAMVAFLASDEARHVCGQAIGVCGNLEWE